VFRRRPQASRPQQHHDDHGERNQHLPQDGRIKPATGEFLKRARDIAEHLGKRSKQHRAQHHTRQMPQPAQHHHGDDHDRLHEAE